MSPQFDPRIEFRNVLADRSPGSAAPEPSFGPARTMSAEEAEAESAANFYPLPWGDERDTQPAPEPATPQTPSTEAEQVRQLHYDWYVMEHGGLEIKVVARDAVLAILEAADRAAPADRIDVPELSIDGLVEAGRMDALAEVVVRERERRILSGRAAPADRIDVETLAEAWANVMDGRRVGLRAHAARIGRGTTTMADWREIVREYDRLRGSR